MTMKNIFFPEEEITKNDLFFMCYMIERVSRKIKQHNNYTVNAIGEKELSRLISLAQTLHCENPLQVEDDWITDYKLQVGNFDITAINAEFTDKVPSPTAIGKVYARLIVDTALPEENFASGILRVYNNEICKKIDDYNASAYYEPSYEIVRAYQNGGF